MERIKSLNTYQKIVLALLTVMLIVFTVLYSVVTSRVGYAYKGAILLPAEENGETIYTGRVRGEDVTVTVTKNMTVTVIHGTYTYGPYTVRLDPTAVDPDDAFSPNLTGMEVLDGDTVLFRGGIWNHGSDSQEPLLFDEDGSYNDLQFSYEGLNGVNLDSQGNPIDQRLPSVVQIIELADGPELTCKGDWALWFMSAFLSVLTAVHIIFADELYRLRLSFYIKDAEKAEPSEWEITSRYLAWTILPIIALVTFIIGLTI